MLLEDFKTWPDVQVLRVPAKAISGVLVYLPTTMDLTHRNFLEFTSAK